MYTVINRRSYDPARMQETRSRAEKEFFPKLQAAKGFQGFYLVNDQENQTNVAISVWEDKAAADAFFGSSSWMSTLDSMGSKQQSLNAGDTMVQLEPANRSSGPS